MRFPTIWVPLYKDGTEREREFSLAALRKLLEAMVQINVMWIVSHLDEFRPLYEIGARYAPEKGTEDWLTIPAIYDAVKSGKPIDCEDFAAARAAELRLGKGVGSKTLGPVHAIGDVRGRVMPNGQVRMHCFVRYPDGSVEDPSTVLGMPGDGAVAWEKAFPMPFVNRMKELQRRKKEAA
jgi:hypothetical protein